VDEQVFRKLGVEQTRELRLHGRADADSDAAAAALRDSTGVFFSGGDQPLPSPARFGAYSV
jgi:cyanophycinase